MYKFSYINLRTHLKQPYYLPPPKMPKRYDILGKVKGIGWCSWRHNGMEMCIVTSQSLYIHNIYRQGYFQDGSLAESLPIKWTDQ